MAPRPARIEPFLLVLKDEDKGLFTIVGPMTDDTPWNHRVAAAQEDGRRVSCYTATRALTRNEVIAEAKRFLGLRYTDEVFI